MAGEARYAAIEDAGRLRDALGVALPVGVPVAFLEPIADPLGDLVSRYARTHGPFTTDAVAGRLGVGTAVARHTLQRLEQQGRVASGFFLPEGQGALDETSGAPMPRRRAACEMPTSGERRLRSTSTPSAFSGEM